jgi:hypothetical protein
LIVCGQDAAKARIAPTPSLASLRTNHLCATVEEHPDHVWIGIGWHLYGRGFAAVDLGLRQHRRRSFRFSKYQLDH